MFATAQWNDSTDGEALNQGYLVDTLSTRPRWRRRSSSDRNAGTGRLAWRAGRATLSLGSELLDPLASVGGERIRGNRL